LNARNIKVAKLKKSQVLQTKFLFNVHFDSLKYLGKRYGIITVVNSPIIVPEKLKNAEL
jgi:hypothetical protein